MDWHTVARNKDYGIGQAGRAIGPPCSVYRATGSGDFIQSGNLLQAGLNIFRRISTSKADQESPTHSFGTMFYELLFDATFFQVGDVVVENDPFYGAGGTEVDYATVQFEAYCLAYHGPIKTVMGARIDRTAQIFRPIEAPDSTNYFSPTIGENVAPLVCTSGVWGLGSKGDTPSRVPVGMMAMPRDRDTVFRGAPGDTGLTIWFCYVPPLNGFNPREGDRILIDSGRYVVKHPYQQQAGLVGSQLMVSREIGND